MQAAEQFHHGADAVAGHLAEGLVQQHQTDAVLALLVDLQKAGADGHIEGCLILAAGGIAADAGQIRLLPGDLIGHLDIVVQIGAVVHIVRKGGTGGGASLLPGAGVLVHVRHDLFHQFVHLTLVGGVGGGGKVVQRVAFGHLLVALVHDDLIERRKLRVPAGFQLKAVDFLAVGQLLHDLVQLPELPPGVEDIVLHAEQDILAEAVLAVPLRLLQTGGVALQVDAHKALVLGAVLFQPGKPQGIITDIALVVFPLRRFQRAVQVDGQGIVQLGLCLFGSLRGGAGRLVRPGQRLLTAAGERLHQRMSGKEALGGLCALFGGVHRFLLLRLAGRDLFFAHAQVAAGLFHGGAGGFPCGFAHLFLLIQLLQHGVLAALRQLCRLLVHRRAGSGQGGAGVPQSGKFFQRCAAQKGLVLAVCGFQVLLCLCGGAHLLGKGVHLPCQCPGAGAAGFQTDIALRGAQTLQPEGMVTQKVPGGAVGVVFQRVGGVAADDAAQDGVCVLRGKRVFAGDLCRQTVGGGGVGAAVGLAQTRGVQQADGAHLLFQRHKGALCGGVVGGRHKDIEPAVAQTGFHAVLPAFVLHVQQLAEDAGVRLHATAFQLGIHGVPHPGGGIAVGIHPLTAGHGIQLGAFLGLLPLQGGGVLPGGKIGFFQRLFLCGQPVGQGRQGVGGQVCHLLPGGKAAAAQHSQQIAGLFGGFFGGVGAAGGGIQCGLPMRQLLVEGVQCAALAAGTGGAVGGQVGAAGLRFGGLGFGVASAQRFLLAASGVYPLLPDGLFPGIGSSPCQQGGTPVHKGFGLFFGGFAAIAHDLVQRIGAGLGFRQNGVQVFQLQAVTLQGFQVQFRLGEDVLVQKLPEVRDLVHAGAHLEHLVELFAQRAGCAPDAQCAAYSVPRFAGAAGIGKPPLGGLEVLLGAGRTGARVDKGQLFQRDAVLGDVPCLVAGVQLLHGSLGLHPHRDDKAGVLYAVPELRPDIRHGMPRAAVGVFAALLGVDRALQGAAAFLIAQRIEVAVGGQAVADGIQNGGLAHGVHADHIGQAGAVEGGIFKVMPVNEFQALEFDHASPSPASVSAPSGRSYRPSSVRVRALSAAASARSASGSASSTVGNTSMRLSSPESRPTGRARLYRRNVRMSFSSVC